jgi:hypothetical protein
MWFRDLGCYRHIPFRVFVYADDVVLFLSPMQGDRQLTNAIFELFESASGLGCNIAKCQVIPIQCDADQVALAQHLFPCPIMEFLIKYLGIPLSTGKLPKAAFQLLIDKMVDNLSAWRGRMMHRSSHLTLIKTTLSSIPIYSAISHAFPPWVLKAFTKISISFLWSGSKSTHGSKCLVVWDRVQQSLQLGGMGIHDLKLMGVPCIYSGYGLSALTQANLGPQC